MAIWEHLAPSKTHIAYACIGVFSTIFSLCSLFIKEKLYIGEASVAVIFGLIVGPHCLNWFAPEDWGNLDLITLEISRMVLIIQIFAVAVELPTKYMKKHWVSVFIFLVPIMTFGWLIVGLFLWIIIPGFNFSEALLVSGCVTATDPVLASAIVGKGKFAERVPGHLRNILSAESGCNDGMAFPFIYLALNLIIHEGNGGLIVQDWICVTLLYECLLGCVLGWAIGLSGRYAIKFAENKGLIDRESFLAFYIVLSFVCAGFGAILGVDDLLTSFAAGTTFAWDGWFSEKTEESQVSTVIDLLLNLAYFVYFGSIIPWEDYNNASIGTPIWRLILIALVIIFLRRIPGMLMLKPVTPDVKTWREALFCGHFGPIGVGAIFASILAKSELESHYTGSTGPLAELPDSSTPHFQLLVSIWPIVTFIIITSIVVHGSSVAVLTLGKHLHTMQFTMTFTHTEGNKNSSNWLNRLPKIDAKGRDISLERIDTLNPSMLSSAATLENSGSNINISGMTAKPAGGMKRRKKTKRSRIRNRFHEETGIGKEQNARRVPEVEDLDLGTMHRRSKEETSTETPSGENTPKVDDTDQDQEAISKVPTTGYTEGNRLIVEDEHGEVIDEYELKDHTPKSQTDQTSVHSYGSFKRALNKISTELEPEVPQKLQRILSTSSQSIKNAKKVLVGCGTKTEGGDRRKLYAFVVGDQVVIENKDGEILRRYKINPHKGESELSDSQLRAGLNNSDIRGLRDNSNAEQPDLEKQENDIVPEEEEVNNPTLTRKMSQKLDNTVQSLIAPFRRTKTASFSVRKKPSELELTESVNTSSNAPLNQQSSSETLSISSEPAENEVKESKVERARRLAALHTSVRDDKDEEGPPVKATKPMK
ncbi:Na+/H+ antiporter [Komagataella phaffii CBS 7435]|uniref:Na+/H+ antiporter involved in sodium and potassium efflux through the plasma membrane n=2 Tax=Komagataella phaffii TaxID=460519 RepID=C4R4H2_KOMPG|nr:Na+/H+ antiporter involved in sodium and potassium efflux through the plasma membrane [Komagataella phaffii GS115]AOA64036.1 GQ67_03478T0 [Komagataella phaffii]CAH2449787.1 Na+/H+ antiporter [Komagataella phaffii CBS 7435]AOA69140.1 GQ68_03448T0 [Komagataella phaffii GS115]CAY70458.1 Na+/H+ antiporter involved in sodium and potassium efflux through the plasma membrane [Komagataella phaffii GS115]CCA39757.1 Na+/H+ antiporter [Komagataella phaffii CBS 7435]